MYYTSSKTSSSTTKSSSISYSKTFSGYPSLNLSLTASHSQNTRTKTVNLVLPTFQGNLERIYPFVKKNAQKKLGTNCNYLTSIERELLNTINVSTYSKRISLLIICYFFS